MAEKIYDIPARMPKTVGPSLWSGNGHHQGTPDQRITMRRGGLRVRQSTPLTKRKKRVTSR